MSALTKRVQAVLTEEQFAALISYCPTEEETGEYPDTGSC